MKWAPVHWIDSRYEVSDTGLVRSFANSRGGRSAQPHALNLQPSNTGYLQVRMQVRRGYFKWFLVHRVVLQAFTNEVGEQCNHKNGAKHDNALANLEWCTRFENRQHALHVLKCRTRVGNYGLTGAKHKLSKKVQQSTLDGIVVRVWDAMAEAARHGFSQGNIAMVCAGQRKHHKGFIWSFI